MTNYPQRNEAQRIPKNTCIKCEKCGSTNLVIAYIANNKGWAMINCHNCKHNLKVRAEQV